jgi:hypothetical protein
MTLHELRTEATLHALRVARGRQAAVADQVRGHYGVHDHVLWNLINRAAEARD